MHPYSVQYYQSSPVSSDGVCACYLSVFDDLLIAHHRERASWGMRLSTHDLGVDLEESEDYHPPEVLVLCTEHRSCSDRLMSVCMYVCVYVCM